MNSGQVDRLFVPLASEPFSWFESGIKSWELRRYGRQYTEKHVRKGRRVELRVGYSDPRRSLWGMIVRVEYANSVEQFFGKVPYEEVIPVASNVDEAMSHARNILGLEGENSGPVLGFQIALEK